MNMEQQQAHPAIQDHLKGILALDASAGTGKTYSIALMYIRLVLSGIPVERILVTTFTEDAAGELRERLRQRLIEARDSILNDTCTDDLLKAAVEKVECEDNRLRLLHTALSDFDLAPITTIHGFCSRLLKNYGLELGADPDAEISADDPALDQFVSDCEMKLAVDLLDNEKMPTHQALIHLAKCVREHPQIQYDTTLCGKAIEEITREAVDVTKNEALAMACDAWKEQGPTIRNWIEESARDGKLAEGFLHSVNNNGNIRWTRLNNTINDLERLLNEKGDEFNPTGVGRLKANMIQAQWRGKNTDDLAILDSSFFKHLDQLESVLELKKDFTKLVGSRLLTAQLQKEQCSGKSASHMTFSDLINGVFNHLNSANFTAAVRNEYDAVLIDESQDTDARQIEIFRTLFASDPDVTDGKKCLVWVGDPKQSIYRFRGADIDTYLRAKAGAKANLTLDTNYRSDPPLVAAVNALFQGPANSHPFGSDIAFEAANAAKPTRVIFQGGACCEPICLHTWSAGEKSPGKDEIFGEIVDDCVAQIHTLLNSGIKICQGTDANTKENWRPISAQDIAVLGRSHSELESIRRELLKRNIPSSYQTNSSVYAGEEARDMSIFLTALAMPDRRPLRAALTTPFFGLSLNEVADISDTDEQEYYMQFTAYARRVEEEGILAVLSSILRSQPKDDQKQSAVARITAQAGGERVITNIIQLAELLQQAWLERHARSPAALKDILDHAIANARDNDSKDVSESTIRLDTDRPAVILSTIHTAKGLQYPIVLLPSIWLERADNNKIPCLVRYDAEGNGTLLLPGDPDWTGALKEEQKRVRAEYMRLLYVALTRAEHQVHVWWGRANPNSAHYLNSTRTAFGKLLLDKPRAADHYTDEECIQAFQTAMKRYPGAKYRIQETGDLVAPPTQTGDQNGSQTDEEKSLPQFEPANWDRPGLSAEPLQSSYSALLRKTADALFKGDDEIQEETGDNPDDEGDTNTKQADEFIPDNGIFDAYQAGRILGDRVHCAYEEAFKHPDDAQDRFVKFLEPRLTPLIRKPADGDPPPDCEATAKQLWSLTTNALLAPDIRFESLIGQHAYPEWEYLLPQKASLNSKELATILKTHGGKSPWGEEAYIERVERLEFSPINGYFEGIVDLVCRMPDGRVIIVDYKTNRLDEGYGPAALPVAMAHTHYYLQALLYTVAVNRWLRMSLDGWNYEEQFVGAAYLFLRGLQDGTSNGVWTGKPPEALVNALENCICGNGDPL